MKHQQKPVMKTKMIIFMVFLLLNLKVWNQALSFITKLLIFFKELYPNKQTELNDFRTYLLDGSNPMTPLKAWQMQDLSLQCAYRATIENTPEEAFNTLVELSQNFPSRAR
jgi:hypothetical protein